MSVLLVALAYVGIFALYELLFGAAYAFLCLRLEARYPKSERVQHMVRTYVVVTIFAALILTIISVSVFCYLRG